MADRFVLASSAWGSGANTTCELPPMNSGVIAGRGGGQHAGREVGDVLRRYEAPGYRDYRMLFGRVDAVSLVVPTALHYEIAREFWQRGVHVLVEKPITTTVEQAAELVDLAHHQGVTLLVGHVERFKPAVAALRDLVTDPLFVQVRRVRPWNPLRVMGVGVVLDLMIHDLDIILTMMRSPVAHVSAIGAAIHGEHEDLAVAHLSLRNGCLATFVASRVLSGEGGGARSHSSRRPHPPQLPAPQITRFDATERSSAPC